MKSCIACNTDFANQGFACPHCGFSPPDRYGIACFISEQDGEQDFPGQAHHMLDQRQAGSFWFRERNALILQLLRKFAPDAKNLFEMGCGTGFVTAGIQHANPHLRLTGSDIHLSGLQHARDRLGSDVQLLQTDALRLPFSREFDVAAAFDVVEHLDDDRQALAGMRETLKAGGVLMLSVPQHPWLWSQTDDIACHKRRYRRGELVQKLREAGLEIVFQTSFVTTLLPVVMLQRIMMARRRDYDPATELGLPRWIDTLFASLLKIERLLIVAGIRLPLGSSRFVVARRPDA